MRPLHESDFTADAEPLLNFDEAGFLSIQAGALALAPQIDAAIGAALAAGASNIHFLGTGGAAIVMRPAVQLLRLRSSFPVFDDPTAELLVSGSRNLTPGSIVVIPSQSGTTRESVEILELAHSRGATVVTLVGNRDTPLGQGGDHVLVNATTDATSSENYYLQGLLVALSVLRHRQEIDDYEALLSGLRTLPQELVNMKRIMEPRAVDYARALASRDYHILTAAGSAWPEACSYGMCVLEEMQWIRVRPVHASDFFHGTFELLEPGVSVVLLKGEDATRPLAERVERFVASIGGGLSVIDTRDFPSIGLSDDLRALLTPVILTTVLERVSAQLEVIRNHPLSTRRYFRRVSY
ncbi:SIS domain-containing protein [Rubellimicrobium rubrum]|uniref:SIS domain-containing protein n=1 Tax=Rubellimicrobium rubrum TaxID=2585369 RepID=UPI001FE5EDB4|nr:SIS domain-containing protein [Rubellimicrobium rubrum]